MNIITAYKSTKTALVPINTDCTDDFQHSLKLRHSNIHDQTHTHDIFITSVKNTEQSASTEASITSVLFTMECVLDGFSHSPVNVQSAGLYFTRLGQRCNFLNKQCVTFDPLPVRSRLFDSINNTLTARFKVCNRHKHGHVKSKSSLFTVLINIPIYFR